MLSAGQNFMYIAPWISILPGLGVLVTVLGFNLMRDGLHNLIDPRTKKP